MVAMRYCDMAAIGSVLVFVVSMLDATINGALIPMVIMLMMQMTIVHVIQVIVMRNCDMAAIGSMNMRMFVLHERIMAYTRSFRGKGVA